MPDRVNRWNRGTDEKLLETPISDKWSNIEGKRNDWKRKMKRHGGDEREIWMHMTSTSGMAGIEGHAEKGGTDSKAGAEHVSTDPKTTTIRAISKLQQNYRLTKSLRRDLKQHQIVQIKYCTYACIKK